MQLILFGHETTHVTIQATLFAQSVGIPHISMQQLCSKVMRDRFSQELQAIEPISLLTSPDTEMLAMLEVRLRQPDARQGWILTDFPTTVAHAQSLLLLLEYMGRPQPQTVYLATQDQSESVLPVVKYYQELGCLKFVDANATAQIVNERILTELKIATFA